MWKHAWKHMVVYLTGRSESFAIALLCGCFHFIPAHYQQQRHVSWLTRVATMLFFVARGGNNSSIVALYVGARREKVSESVKFLIRPPRHD
jgi:hypothetical protein